MKLSKIFIFAFLVLTVAGAANQTSAQNPKGKPVKKSKLIEPRTVKDFYMLLPAKFFPYVETVKNRADLIGSMSADKNLLMFDSNRPIQPVNAQILLLRRTSGASLLAISYTNCLINDCQGSLRFVEYERGRWTEIKGAPPLNRPTMDILFEKKAGRAPGDNAYLIYDISALDKSITVQLYSVPDKADIYKLEWDGNIYDFAVPNE